MNFGIYFYNPTADLDIINNLHHDLKVINKLDIHVFNNIDEFLQSECKTKLVYYSVPWPYNDSWLEVFQKIHPYVDKSIVFGVEMHFFYEDLKKIDLPNTELIIPGFLNTKSQPNIQTYQFNNINFTFWPFFFPPTVELNFDYYQDKNFCLLNNFIKPKVFDALLGRARAEKDFVYSFLTEHNLLDNNIVTYIKSWTNITLSDSYTFQDKEIKTIEGYPDGVIFLNNRKEYLVNLLPKQIYNNSYFSLIVETSYSNEYNFFTEKTFKPLLAGRVFIVIAGLGYLKNLKELGFMTFHGIIDESYDLEPDREKRFTMALNEVKRLCSADQRELINKANSILEHNQALAKKFNRDYVIGQLYKKLETYYNEQ